MAVTARRRIARLMDAVSLSWYHLAPAYGQAHRNGFSEAQKEYAFEMACSNIRFGMGVTREIGLDFKNIGSKKICLVTDKNLVEKLPVKVALQSLEDQNLNYRVFDGVRVEPTDESLKVAIGFAKMHGFDAFLAVGGGSVIDTCKAANLYSSNPSADFVDYVNSPLGKGHPIMHTLKPLIAVTTTAGTGSETTGTAVFDFLEIKSKTGISSRSLRPTLGIVDPLNLSSLPERVAAWSGLDVLCHALESYTAIPYSERIPRPASPELRPAYQGSNPISDIWCQKSLQLCKKYLVRSIYDSSDIESRSSIHLASSYAGIGFGNSGVHLCHGLSYPISGLVKNYVAEGYHNDHSLIPHGLSVIITAPAVFRFTASACPGRHLEGARLLGADVTNVKLEDAGKVLADTLLEILHKLKVPNGLKELGFTTDDIPALVKGTLPQHRVTKLSPKRQTDEELAQSLAELLEDSMTLY